MRLWLCAGSGTLDSAGRCQEWRIPDSLSSFKNFHPRSWDRQVMSPKDRHKVAYEYKYTSMYSRRTFDRKHSPELCARTRCEDTCTFRVCLPLAKISLHARRISRGRAGVAVLEEGSIMPDLKGHLVCGRYIGRMDLVSLRTAISAHTATWDKGTVRRLCQRRLLGHPTSITRHGPR